MQSFIYVARNLQTGQKVTAEVEAEDQSAASKLLTDRGLAPIDITPKAEKKSLIRFRNSIPAKQLVVFSRQLSTLVNSGLPLVQSLNAVNQQTTYKKLQPIITSVVKDVEGGMALAQAMSRHPEAFNEVYIALVAAGETSGTLDVALERLANQQEKDAEIVSRLRGALIYPFLVILVLFGVIIFLMTSVLPQIQSLYNGLPGAKLPPVTVVLLDSSHFISKWWWIFLLFNISAIYGFMRWIKTTNGRKFFDNVKLHAWPIGPLFTKLYMARFSRVGSTLVASGVPLIQVLNTTSKSIGNVHIEASILRAAEMVKGGKALSDSLQNDKHFLELVPNMIRTGEKSGSLDQMMAKLADYYEKEVDNQIKSVSTVIEPLLMVVVGIIALIVVAAVLLPIYSLAGKNLITH